MKRCLCLWFPNWPIQRLVVKEPTLRKTHLVLFRHDPRRGQRVSAASPLAIQDGVKIDMPVSEVKQLLRSTGRKRQTHQPNVNLHPRTQHRHIAKEGIAIGQTEKNKTSSHPSSATSLNPPTSGFSILEHDPIADRDALEQVVDSLHPYSPLIGLESSDSPESCLLDITGLAALFRGEINLQNQATCFLNSQGYVVYSAIANTAGMAWGLARYQCSSPNQDETADEQALERQFQLLPIAALRLLPSTLETLRQLGFERIEQLLSVPRADLATRFGDEINRRLDQAFGKIEEPIVARHLPAEFTASQFLEFPTQHRETIEVILSRLIQDICKRMAATQKGALQWKVRLDCVDRPTIQFEVNLFQPTTAMPQVMQLVEMQLETALKPHLRRKRRRSQKKQQAKRPPNDQSTTAFVPSSKDLSYTTILIQEITVSVTSCVLLIQRQRKLFDESPSFNKQALAHLINHLTSRLGQQCVVYPTLQPDAQPEHSFQFKPLVDPTCLRSRKQTAAKEHSHKLSRPPRLLAPAVRIHPEVKNNGAPQSSPPIRFSHSTSDLVITKHWGPERIETGWWRGPTTRRDYWRIEIDTGQHLWIYRDLRNQQWFLHGEF